MPPAALRSLASWARTCYSSQCSNSLTHLPPTNSIFRRAGSPSCVAAAANGYLGTTSHCRILPAQQRKQRSTMSSSNKTTSQIDDERGMLVVSIMGPSNAGKSTLFNRLMCKDANRAYRLASEKRSRRRRGAQGRVGHNNPSKRPGGAIVSSTPGTTRDRRECIGRIGGTLFRLLDTAGVDGEKIGHLVGKGKDPMERAMIQQTLKAAKSADLVLLMFDARVGVTTDLAETSRWLRKVGPGDDSSHREVRLLANKLEGDAWSANYDSAVMSHLEEASRVGFGEALPISAEHGEGLADVAAVIEELTEAKRKRLGISTEYDDEGGITSGHSAEKPLQLAILGRQNVGKSTLVNALLKQERVITGPTPGLTRDSIAVKWSWRGRPVQLTDTAGIRKGAQRDRSDDIEDLAVQDAMRAMKTADVAVLVLDAEARVLQRQELAIADAVVKEGRSLVVAANKMDLLIDEEYSKEDYADAVQEQIEIRFPMLRKTPVVPMSSLTGENVDRLTPVVFNARDRWAQMVNTGLLNRWLKEVLDTQAPPLHNGRPIKIKYIMQTKGRPPSFLLFSNVEEIPTSYLRYVTRNFQEAFQMYGMEVRMSIKKSAENPYQEKKTSNSVGIGGWQGRTKRLVKSLKQTGAPPKRKRKRYKR
mmetsp:Transcript_32518/g.71377  ORF Transcript_32518/g.71377 Transcript_32518/m.71377 type:complete len:646 (-) Transcript_32518:1040-2977(-)